MIKLTYTRLALQDLARIHAWSVEHFGDDQAEHYLREIEAKLEKAAAAPSLFRDASFLRPGLVKLRTGSHLAYVMLSPGRLQVVRILHARMDPERWV